jgi:hypothetical protein
VLVIDRWPGGAGGEHSLQTAACMLTELRRVEADEADTLAVRVDCAPSMT